MPVSGNLMITFGKYMGKKISDIPPGYLLSLLANKKCIGSVKQFIKENEKRLKEEASNA